MESPLLLTKTFPPPARGPLVQRPRLAGRVLLSLRQGRKLVLVSAPPGFGKTTLAGEVIRQSGSAAAWLALDANENDPVQFWQYAIAALRRSCPGLGELAQAMLDANQPPPLENVLAGLLNELAALTDPLIFVLDDYQVIESPEVHESLNFFLDHLPPPVALVITTRSDPPLGLALRRARGELVEIRAADLRFSSEEAAEFLSALANLTLPPADLDVLLRRTEGWVAGLQLAALALRSEPARAAETGEPPLPLHDFVVTFAGDDRYIGDYLVEEVLQRQPREIQEFLLRTSILDRFCAGLCREIITDTGAAEPAAATASTLVALERANLFLVPLDQRQEWYRYHRLFAELLQRLLLQSYGEARVKELHLRASRWFEGAGLWSEAVDHALRAGAETRALNLVETRAVDLFQRSEMPAVREWILRLPERLVFQSLPLCVSLGWAAMATGRVAEVERAVEAIGRGLGLDMETFRLDPGAIKGMHPGVPILLANAVILRSSADLTRLRLEQAIEGARSVLVFADGLAGEEYQRVKIDFCSIAWFNLGVSYQLLGEVAQARQAFERAISESEQTLNPHILTMSISHLGQILAAQGQPGEAREMHELSLRKLAGLAGGRSPLRSIAHAGLGLLAYERNDLEEACAQFERCLELGLPWNNWESLIPAYLGLANAHLARGQTAEALALLEKAHREWQHAYGPEGFTIFREWRALLAGEAAEMAAAADALKQSNPPQVNLLTYIAEDMLLLRALLLLRLDRLDEAQDILDRVDVSAEEGGRTGVLIQALVLRSAVFERRNAREQALTCLERALALGYPGEYARSFLDRGEHLGSLLAAVAAKRQGGDMSGYAARLLAAWQQESGAGQAAAQDAPRPGQAALPDQRGLVEPLTGRELEILGLVAQGLTNPQIAARLVITPGTVKVHANNIYAKLGVQNRTAAVAKARELGLI